MYKLHATLLVEETDGMDEEKYVFKMKFVCQKKKTNSIVRCLSRLDYFVWKKYVQDMLAGGVFNVIANKSDVQENKKRDFVFIFKSFMRKTSLEALQCLLHVRALLEDLKAEAYSSWTLFKCIITELSPLNLPGMYI